MVSLCLKQGILRKDDQCDSTPDDRLQKLKEQLPCAQVYCFWKHTFISNTSHWPKNRLPIINHHFWILKEIDFWTERPVINCVYKYRGRIQFTPKSSLPYTLGRGVQCQSRVVNGVFYDAWAENRAWYHSYIVAQALLFHCELQKRDIA